MLGVIQKQFSLGNLLGFDKNKLSISWKVMSSNAWLK